MKMKTKMKMKMKMKVYLRCMIIIATFFTGAALAGQKLQQSAHNNYKNIPSESTDIAINNNNKRVAAEPTDDTSTNIAIESPVAHKGIYIGVQGGAAFFHELDSASGVSAPDVNTGYSYGGYVGYRFTENWRTDLTIDYTNNNSPDVQTEVAPGVDVTETDSVKQLHVMLNGYFDFPTGKLTPFVGLGLGYSKVSGPINISVDGYEGNIERIYKAGLGAQSTIGCKYSIYNNLDLGLAYRMLITNGKEFDQTTGDYVAFSSIENSIISMSLTYNFSNQT